MKKLSIASLATGMILIWPISWLLLKADLGWMTMPVFVWSVVVLTTLVHYGVNTNIQTTIPSQKNK